MRILRSGRTDTGAHWRELRQRHRARDVPEWRAHEAARIEVHTEGCARAIDGSQPRAGTLSPLFTARVGAIEDVMIELAAADGHRFSAYRADPADTPHG